MNREIALVYQGKILKLLEQKQWGDAETLIMDALDFDSELSGLWYARGQIDKKLLNYKRALEYNTLALRLDQWDDASYRDAVILQMELQNTLGMFEEMILLSEKLPELMRWDQDILWYRSLALNRSGRLEESLESAGLGRNLYPDDPRFFQILLQQKDPVILEDFDNHWGDRSDVVNRVFYPLLTRDSRDPVKSYFLRHGEGYLKDFWALPDGSLETVESYLYRYPDIYDLDVLELLYGSAEREARTLILDFMDRSEHSFQGDWNRDGISETRLYRRSDGWEYRIDSDQDGVFEKEANILEGRLRYLQSWNGKDYLYSYGYGAYLDQITVETDSARRVYSFPIGARRGTFPAYNNLFELLSGLKEQDEESFEPEFLKTAERIEEFGPEGILFRTYFLNRGEFFLVREDSDLNGKEDRLFRVDKGKILAGIRDLDEDGVFDLYEYYHQGLWEGLMLDRQQDGTGDYLESWNPIELKLWDFNQDDLWDTGFIKEPFFTIINPRELGSIDKEDTHFWDFSYEKYWFH